MPPKKKTAAAKFPEKKVCRARKYPCYGVAKGTARDGYVWCAPKGKKKTCSRTAAPALPYGYVKVEGAGQRRVYQTPDGKFFRTVAQKDGKRRRVYIKPENFNKIYGGA